MTALIAPANTNGYRKLTNLYTVLDVGLDILLSTETYIAVS